MHLDSERAFCISASYGEAEALSKRRNLEGVTAGIQQSREANPGGSDGARNDPRSDAAIARLDMANKIRHSNYNSIWEQQKHFTWLISIMLSAQALVAAAVKLDSFQKSAVLFVASTVGIITSIVGFRVQRIEGIYFAKPTRSSPKNTKLCTLVQRYHIIAKSRTRASVG